MLIYFIIASVSILTGMGILKLFRISLNNMQLITLAPVITMSAWIILLSFAILAGWPVKQLALPLWTFSGLFSIYGITHFFKNEKISSARAPLFILFLPLIIMLPFFLQNQGDFPGSLTPDSLSYLGNSQFLWEYPRGILANGLNLLYQYAAYFNHARFSSYALLAFFSSLTKNPGDTQMIASAYISWLLFVIASSCAFFATTQNLKKWSIFYLIIIIFSGWITALLNINNYDNALALAILPAIAGICVIFKRDNYRWSAILALLIATALYCYLELFPPIFVSALIFICYGCWLNKIGGKKLLFLFLMGTILFLALVFPYRHEILNYFFSQLNSVQTPEEKRPGVLFSPSLLDPHYFLMEFWGLRHTFVSKILAVVMTVTGIFGFIQLFRQKQWHLLSVLFLMLFAMAIMLVKFHYPYGAYKFILLSWWLLAFILVLGAKSILQYKPSSQFITILLALFFVSYLLTIQSQMPKPNHLVAELRKIRMIQPFVKNQIILADINNHLMNNWAVYFLRDMNVCFNKKYMGIEDTCIDKKSVFFLTDNSKHFPDKKLIWSNQNFYLWKNYS